LHAAPVGVHEKPVHLEFVEGIDAESLEGGGSGNEVVHGEPEAEQAEPREHVERLGESFAERVAAAWLRADTLARLRWHQSRGDRTVLVSASLGQYLRPLGRRLGVDGVLCAEPRREGGVFGRGLEGANCRRAEKVRRLEEWLVAHGLERAVVWAYGDSSGDTELLSRADHPLWVRDVTVDPVPVGFGPSGSGPSGFGS
ncbi:MAG: HAD-IB family hydrolase, partial [Ilumatobacteraceae bacterium]